MKKLTDRKKIILSSLIQEYIKTGDPVSSRSVTKNDNVSCSSATVRNELSELEDMGLLEKSHSFSGRLPSDVGYRFFVDNLMDSVVDLSLNEKERISSIYSLRNLNSSRSTMLKDIFLYGVNVLNNLCDQAAFICEARSIEKSVKAIKIIKVSSLVYTVIFHHDNNVIENKLWFPANLITDEGLETMNNVLQDITSKGFKDLSNDVKNYFQKNKGLNHLREGIIEIVELVLDGGRESNIDDTLYIEGISKLIQKPEFASMEKIRSIIQLFESKELLNREIKKLLILKKMNIKIGSELGVDDLNDFSLISIPYSAGEDKKGVIGIIGTKRMQYERIVKIVRETAEKLSSLLVGIDLDL